jgi:predicted ABC-type ATPase
MPIHLDGPTLTIIGGPNGSGKSSIIALLKDLGYALPNYLNADDVASGLAGNIDERNVLAQTLVRNGRDAAIEKGLSLTYETVMSHDSHVEAMRRARAKGFFVRLIFVGTDNPEINVARVADRVAKGGHDVPVDRIHTRYQTIMRHSLRLAIRAVDEAMVFDTSYLSGPLRVAHVIQKFVRVWPTPGIDWPRTAFLDDLRADPDYVFGPQ